MRRGSLLFPTEKVREVVEADAAIHEVSKRGKLRTPEHKEAVRRFRDAIDAVWPPEIWAALEPPYDDPGKLDLLLRFLEEDPYFFRSGYIKENALGRIGKFPLDADARRRIACIVLRAVDGPGRREFRRVCNVAFHADRDVLVPALRVRLDSDDAARVWRAFCAARGMLRMPIPRGHVETPIAYDLSGGLAEWIRQHADHVERIESALKRSAEAHRDENLAQIAAMRERLHVTLSPPS